MPGVELDAIPDCVMRPPSPSCISTTGTQTELGAERIDVSAPSVHADTKTIEECLQRARSTQEQRAERGCEEVGWLALEEANREAVGACGGVETLLDCLKRWMGKRAAILEAAMKGLGNLLTVGSNIEAFYDYCYATNTTWDNRGGSILVAAAMSGYPLKTNLQMYGCIVVKRLACDPINVERFVQCGLVGYVLAAMHRNLDTPMLLLHGIEAFAALDLERLDIAKWIAEEGVALEYVIDAFAHHLENSAIVGAAAAVLLAVSSHPSLHPALRKTTAVEYLLQALAVHSLNPSVSLPILRYLEPHIEFYPSRLEECAVVVKKVMSRNAEVELLTACLWVIEKLGRASPNDVCTQRLAKHLMPYAAAALQSFDDDEELVEAANAALGGLVVNKWSTVLHRPRRPPRHANPSAPLPPPEEGPAA
eukprot:Sspe_Gene.73071::Locus_43869_Transcript_1_1_Confidence_1.000_Length_1437::g.73071::m.73071